MSFDTSRNSMKWIAFYNFSLKCMMKKWYRCKPCCKLSIPSQKPNQADLSGRLATWENCVGSVWLRWLRVQNMSANKTNGIIRAFLLRYKLVGMRYLDEKTPSSSKNQICGETLNPESTVIRAPVLAKSLGNIVWHVGLGTKVNENGNQTLKKFWRFWKCVEYVLGWNVKFLTL